MEELNNFFKVISLKTEELENNQNIIINKLEEFNNVFDEEIEKALKNSVFEYKIINIFVVEKENNEYQNSKKNCSNKEIKILFHGTSIDAITGILSTQFRDARIHIFGEGVYFTDELDYAWYYAGEKSRGNATTIPRIGDTFSFVASETYYNKDKLETVYNCKTRDKAVEKYGIRCAYVDYNTALMNKDELENYKGFIGNEFLISDKSQILPLYAVTLKRVEYLVIWRDINFNEKNPNDYNIKVFNKMKEFHRKIKTVISNELNSKVYYTITTDEALYLINRKKYNKIIIVTNGSNQGKEFILKARKIIGGNTIAAVSAYDVERHIKWVKDMKNVILLNGEDFHIKFFKSAINEDINLLNQLRIEIINYYKSISNFKLKEFNKDLFNFPNFKNGGKFEDLKFTSDSCNIF